MNVAMLLFHALLAVALIGALTHQALSVWWPATGGNRSFFGNFRAVRAACVCVYEPPGSACMRD